MVQVLLQPTLVLCHTRARDTTLGWWLLAAALGSALPMLVLIYGISKGSWIDHHVPQREHRIVPMLTILTFRPLGYGSLSLTAAPARSAPSFSRSRSSWLSLS